MKKKTTPDIVRCPWATNELNIPYHDEEWGVPIHDDRALFEFLILEGAQAGFSWDIILKKRARYRQVFDNFDPEKIALYGKRKVKALLADQGIIRNRLKIDAAVGSAKAFLGLQEEFGSFDKYIADFTKNIGEVFDLIFKFTKNPPPSPCRKHLQEFIDFAAGANRTPIGFYQAYPGLSVQDIHALIADNKSALASAGSLGPPRAVKPSVA